MLELLYKDTKGNYSIKVNSISKLVNERTIIKIIRETPSKMRNCLIRNGVVCLKKGKIKIVKCDNDYVEIVQYGIGYNNIIVGQKDFTDRPFISYKKYADIFKLEDIKVNSWVGNGNIDTRFGNTNALSLSGGMQSLLSLAWNLDNNEDFIMNLTSCEEKYTAIAFEMIYKSKTSCKVMMHRKFMDLVGVPIKFGNKLYNNGVDLLIELND